MDHRQIRTQQTHLPTKTIPKRLTKIQLTHNSHTTHKLTPNNSQTHTHFIRVSSELVRELPQTNKKHTPQQTNQQIPSRSTINPNESGDHMDEDLLANLNKGMRVGIHYGGASAHITIDGTSYNPDILDDITNRLNTLFTNTLTTAINNGFLFTIDDDEDDDEDPIIEPNIRRSPDA